MTTNKIFTILLVVVVFITIVEGKRKKRTTRASPSNFCGSLPSWQELKSALVSSTPPEITTNGGEDFPVWAAIVDEGGYVCTVANSGSSWDQQKLSGRAEAVAKAFTAVSHSVDGFSLSSGNLYSSLLPGGMRYGQAGNTLKPDLVNEGDQRRFGTRLDPFRLQRVGGTTGLAGGLALYRFINGVYRRVGAIGVAGDSNPCADHNVAWRVRKIFGFDGHIDNDDVKGPASPIGTSDALIHDRARPDNGLASSSESGYGHPICSTETYSVAESLFPRAAYIPPAI